MQKSCNKLFLLQVTIPAADSKGTLLHTRILHLKIYICLKKNIFLELSSIPPWAGCGSEDRLSCPLFN